MNDSPNVFLSWSGERSRRVAEALHGWIRRTIQTARPFHSDKDIETGAFWDDVVRGSLKTVQFAIVCCTPENIRAPWLNYEAGALAERLGGNTVPLLLGARPEALQLTPLSRLQAREASQSGTLDVMRTLNSKLPQPLDAEILSETFDSNWSKLEEKLKAIPEPQARPPERTEREMLEELILLCREMANERERPLVIETSTAEAIAKLSSFKRIKEGIFKGMTEADLDRLAAAAKLSLDQDNEDTFLVRRFGPKDVAADEFRFELRQLIGAEAYRKKAMIEVDAATDRAVSVHASVRLGFHGEAACRDTGVDPIEPDQRVRRWLRGWPTPA